ncbi:hypothetical protein GOODEAATRI_028425 [Goodea atripinnis]|uniref:Uncharacterized protein n=1 Tax=Goodea atripinnis TaxID=208336 RepID=A0ABV0MW29_9TELE
MWRSRYWAARSQCPNPGFPDKETGPHPSTRRGFRLNVALINVHTSAACSVVPSGKVTTNPSMEQSIVAPNAIKLSLPSRFIGVSGETTNECNSFCFPTIV